MKHLLQIATFVIALLASLSLSAQELTVTSLTSNATDGIIITFSQDVKVSHSVFGTRCYKQITDKDGTPSSLNAAPTTQGNVVTLAAAYCTFVNGHHIHLELNPECFTTLDGTTQLSGTTAFDFVMGDGAAAEPITAVQIAPANGTLTRLGNIAVVFSPTIAEIVDSAGFTVVNEKGHSLPILNVIIDTETSIHALNVNIDTEQAELEDGTTYSLHIAPGAIKCGSITNDKELVYGKWYIKPEPLALVTNPPHQRMVESISQITVKAENGKMLACNKDYKGLQITGIMEDQRIVFANVTKISSDRIGSTFTLTLDKPVNAETLAAAGAMYSFVKLSFPAGLFSQGSSCNDAFQTVWRIGTPPQIGEVYWRFSPASGSKLESLGTLLTVEKENGQIDELYTLRFSITGTNAYMTITDAQNIKLIDANTGRTVKAFVRNDLRQENNNAFMLLMDQPITRSGRYSLVIPAACVSYYADPEHYSAPQQPLTDIVATWTVGDADLPYYGDANGDGVITVADIAVCIDYQNNGSSSTISLKNADFDADGKVTLSDIQQTIKKLLRINTP